MTKPKPLVADTVASMKRQRDAAIEFWTAKARSLEADVATVARERGEALELRETALVERDAAREELSLIAAYIREHAEGVPLGGTALDAVRWLCERLANQRELTAQAERMLDVAIAKRETDRQNLTADVCVARADRDAWKAKAEALEEDVATVAKERDAAQSLVKRGRALVDGADKLRAKAQEIAQAALDDNGRLAAELEGANRDRDEMRGNYEGACRTIASMHAAAVGEVRGPTRGVVEDVADLRADRDLWRKRAEVIGDARGSGRIVDENGRDLEALAKALAQAEADRNAYRSNVVDEANLRHAAREDAERYRKLYEGQRTKIERERTEYARARAEVAALYGRIDAARAALVPSTALLGVAESPATLADEESRERANRYRALGADALAISLVAEEANAKRWAARCQAAREVLGTTIQHDESDYSVKGPSGCETIPPPWERSDLSGRDPFFQDPYRAPSILIHSRGDDPLVAELGRLARAVERLNARRA